jgi:uncharacterized protein with FMN-binding domain
LRRVILAICATAVGLVLLLSFKSHTQSAAGTSPSAALGSPTPGSTGAAGTGASGDGAGGASAAATPGSTESTGSAAKSGTTASGTGKSGPTKTVTGAAWPTIYGPVQVRITVTDGKLTAVTATEYPEETPRDYQINSFAIPELNSEALAAGSAKIDTVSGASYTSGGYVGSLQSALDKAGI